MVEGFAFDCPPVFQMQNNSIIWNAVGTILSNRARKDPMKRTLALLVALLTLALPLRPANAAGVSGTITRGEQRLTFHFDEQLVMGDDLTLHVSSSKRSERWVYLYTCGPDGRISVLAQAEKNGILETLDLGPFEINGTPGRELLLVFWSPKKLDEEQILEEVIRYFTIWMNNPEDLHHFHRWHVWQKRRGKRLVEVSHYGFEVTSVQPDPTEEIQESSGNYRCGPQQHRGSDGNCGH